MDNASQRQSESKGAAEEEPPSSNTSYDPTVFQRPHPDDRGEVDGKPRKKGSGRTVLIKELLQSPPQPTMPATAEQDPQRITRCMRLLWLAASMKTCDVIVTTLPTDDENVAQPGSYVLSVTLKGYHVRESPFNLVAGSGFFSDVLAQHKEPPAVNESIAGGARARLAALALGAQPKGGQRNPRACLDVLVATRCLAS